MTSFLQIWDGNRAISVLETDLLIEAPNFTPDGAALLVNGEGRLYRVDLARPELVLLDTGAAIACNNDHGITPDGKTLILSSHHGGQGSEIYLFDGALRKFSTAAPSWWHGISPDGQTLAFVAARDGSVIDVYTQGLTGPERRLTGGEGHCDGPDYSADGTRIYYNCDRDGHAQIWVMNADGSDQRKLFADDYVNWFPHPSSNGRDILYLAYPPGTLGHPRDLPVALCLMNSDGGNRRRLIEFTGGQGSINVPCWSPDGSRFAFVRYD